MKKYLFLNFLIILSINAFSAEQIDPVTKRAVALYGDVKHNKKCDKVMRFFRTNSLIGKKSHELTKLFSEKKWLLKASEFQVGNLGGWIPVEYGDRRVYCLHIFPNTDEWSNYTVYISIDVQGRDYDEIDFELKDFLSGKVKDKKAVIHQIALCIPGMKQNSDDAKIEVYPKKLKR